LFYCSPEKCSVQEKSPAANLRALSRIEYRSAAASRGLDSGTYGQSRSSEQAPAPRGSPHVPHGAAGSLEWLPFAETAKTESCGESLRLSHFGQAGFWLPKINASKRWEQFSQTYSKIGIGI